MPTVEDWIIKLMEHVEMAELTNLVREKQERLKKKGLESLKGLFAEIRKD